MLRESKRLYNSINAADSSVELDVSFLKYTSDNAA